MGTRFARKAKIKWTKELNKIAYCLIRDWRLGIEATVASTEEDIVVLPGSNEKISLWQLKVIIVIDCFLISELFFT